MKCFFDKLTLRFSGFSMVEFVLILTIFSIMAGVTMFNFKGFRSNVALENLAYDIALSIANVQQRAASGTSGASGVPTGVFQGIEFTYNSGAGPAKFLSEFKMFSDIDGNKKYSTGDILIDKIKIQYNEYIEDIQFHNSSSFGTAGSGPNASISIMFRRPWMDSYFYNLSTGSGVLISNDYARITIASPGGSTVVRKYIIISRAGQISVQ
jgi:type II secretory pathway pseudopilin PulG